MTPEFLHDTSEIGHHRHLTGSSSPQPADVDPRAGDLEVELARERARAVLFGRAQEPRRIGRYLLLAPVGEGGMGMVFAAYDPELDRKVALKLVRTSSGSADSSRRRFRNEARTMARLSHPNVVPVYETVEHEGQLAVVMELVDGCDLRVWIRTVRDWREVVRVLIDAGRGLAAAHAVGVIHRDFKPANVLIGFDGRARVTDFGLAQPVDGIESPGVTSHGSPLDPAVTEVGAVVGTPAYLAPERYEGRRADAESDQFAFGVSAYELLFGRSPFRANRSAGVVTRIRFGHPDPAPSSPAVPPRVRQAVMRALARDPGRRHRSMNAMVDELEASLRPRRRWLPVLLASAVAVAVVLIVPSQEAPARTAVEPCHGFDPSAARAWTDDRRDELSRTSDSRVSAWLVDQLESYAHKLRHARAVACGNADEVAARGQLRCLDDLERDHETTLDLLASHGGDAEGIVTMVDELPAPSRCASAKVDSVADPEVAALLSRARVLVRAGKAHDAYASAVLACARLQRHDVPQWAECRLVTGEALSLLGRIADAKPPLEEAFDVGVELGHDAVIRDAAESLGKLAILDRDEAAARRWREELRSVGQRIGDPTAELVAQILEAELLAISDRVAEAVGVLTRALEAPDADAISPRLRLHLELRLAIYNGALGDGARAHVHFDRASALLATVPDAEAAFATTILVKRAQQLREDGRFEDALAGYRSALEQARTEDGSTSVTVLTALDGIADLLTRLGRLDEARAAADESVRVASSTGNPGTHIDALLTRGRVHLTAGDEEAARRDASEALVLAESEYAVHRRIVGAREVLAIALRELGELEAARRVAEIAVRESEELLGANHPSTLKTTIALANIEDDLGHLERAMELHVRARDGLIAALGPDHPAVGVEHYNIGVLRRRDDDPLAAVVEFERSLAITRATLGDTHPETRETEEQLAAAREAARGRR